MINLSIITINLNNKVGLQRTIESVLCQSFADYEYIVIDGGSTDGSIETIQKYTEATLPNGEGLGERFYWVSEPDKGIYNAMNKGIKQAKGEYCLFLNSGDTLYKEDVLQKIFIGEPEEDFLYGNLEFDNGSEKWIGYAPSKLTVPHLLEFALWHPSTCIKRIVFEEIGLYDETYKIAGDYEFFLRAIIANQRKPVHIDVLVSVFKLDGISSSNASTNSMISEKERARIKHVPSSVLEVYNELQLKLCEMQKQKDTLRAEYNTLLQSKSVRLANTLRKIFRFNTK